MLELHSPAGSRRSGCAAAVTGTLHCDSRKVGAGRRLHRLARRRHRRPQARACGAGAGRGGLPGGARRRRGLRLRRRRPSRPTRGLKAATGPIAAAYFDAAEPSSCDVLAVTGTNGKTSTAWWLAQALSNLRAAAIPCGADRHAGHRPAAARGVHRPHHARPGAAAAPVPPLRSTRASRPARSRPRRSASSSAAWTARAFAWRSSPISPRTTWTTTARWRPTGRPRPSCSAGRACRPRSINIDDEKGRELCAVAARRRARPVDRLLRASRRGCMAPRHRLRRRRACASWCRRAASGTRWRTQPDRPVQRVQPAGRARRPCARWACRWRRRCGLRRPAAGARAHGAPERARQAAGGGRLRPHARRAGQGACRRCAPLAAAARRQAVVRVRLRRRPRPDQAPADGGRGARRMPTAWSSPATTRAARSPRTSSARSCWACRTANACRCRPTARWPSPRPSAAAAPQDVVLLAGKGHEDYQEIAGVKHAVLRPGACAGGAGCEERAA